MYTFSPKYKYGEGVVKKINEHYSTHIPPFDFEIDESKDMFICGKEYSINENKVLELYESGYAEFITPELIIQEEVFE